MLHHFLDYGTRGRAPEHGELALQTGACQSERERERETEGTSNNTKERERDREIG